MDQLTTIVVAAVAGYLANQLPELIARIREGIAKRADLVDVRTLPDGTREVRVTITEHLTTEDIAGARNKLDRIIDEVEQQPGGTAST